MYRDIKVLAMDVDGTLTDGKIYVGAQGECFKVFDVKDGYAIKHLLPQMGIVPVVITGRESVYTVQRCNELGLSEIYQGVADKKSLLPLLCERYHILPLQIAFIGDDLNDLEIMTAVGLSACPANAAAEVLEIATYVCQKSGGDSAVREFCDWLRKIECK